MIVRKLGPGDAAFRWRLSLCFWPVSTRRRLARRLGRLLPRHWGLDLVDGHRRTVSSGDLLLGVLGGAAHPVAQVGLAGPRLTTSGGELVSGGQGIIRSWRRSAHGLVSTWRPCGALPASWACRCPTSRRDSCRRSSLAPFPSCNRSGRRHCGGALRIAMSDTWHEHCLLIGFPLTEVPVTGLIS